MMMPSSPAMSPMMPSTPAMAAMMAAMMLPGALPAIVRSARSDHGTLHSLRFAGSYLVVWFVAGFAIFAIYSPPAPAPAIAAAVVVAALLYELTPVARACRRRCRAERRSGLRFGGWCLGSSLGVMAAFVVLDPMSLPLMCAAGAVALIQKELLS
jgi:predicted metal-binding membrane protein